MNIWKECPVCNHEAFTHFLTCKDYLVSGESFSIVSCNNCQFKFTNPVPEQEKIGQYYASEEYISHSNTSKGLINNAYKLVRNYTLLKKQRLITSINGKRGTVLDIGCGTGEFLTTCKKKGWETIGIEPGNEARKYATDKHQLTVHQNTDAIQHLHNHFDVITLWHVLEHVHNLTETIILLKKLLKKTGSLIIALPNCSSLDAQKYQQYWAAYDVPRHFYHFTPKDINALFEKHQLQVQEILPMWFDSFYISMLSEKHKYGKTNLLRSVYTGLISNMKAIKNGTTFSSQIYVIKTT